MAQLERLSTSSEYSRNPQSQNSAASEQLLQGDVLSGQESSNSPIFIRTSDQDDHNKKSVLMKVREKAKKLKHSLSGKKKHGMEIHDDNHDDYTDTTHPLTLKVKDAADDGDDPEYLGAPMYESEQAPEPLKEYSRQHPRASPVVPGNHTLSNCLETEGKQGTAQPVSAKLGKVNPISQKKTIARSVSDKPAYAKVSDETDSVASKIQGLSITNPNEQDTTNTHTGEAHVVKSPAVGSGYVSGRLNDDGLKNSERKSESREHSANSPQKRDKGVSRKEYFMPNLDPERDETEPFQVPSGSLSPAKSPSRMGVVEKVREAVSSLLWTEEADVESQLTFEDAIDRPSSPAIARKLQSSEANHTTNPISSSENRLGNHKNPSTLAPVHTSTNEAVEEQTHGRILQTN